MKFLYMWFANIALNIIRIKERDKSIMIFGAWGGDNYSDNSKYLFEYITDEYPDAEAVWITKKETVKNELVESGYKCFLYNEPQGIKYRLKSGFVFFTNSISDVGDYDLCQGAIKVALWHGMPLKKLCYATNNIQKKNTSLLRFLQYLYLKSYNGSQRDVSIATSNLTKTLIDKSFEVGDKNIFITGQPRNDALFSDRHRGKLLSSLNHEQQAKFLLYMPTWRNFGNHDSFLDDVVDNLILDCDFMRTLKKNNIFLYIKPHPRITVKSQGKGNIRMLNSSFEFDVQQLMQCADVLITDYSSAFIDYALLDRPIYFYTPDLIHYKKNGNDLFVDFESFSSFKIESIEVLKRVLISDEYLQSGMNNCKRVNLLFNDSKLKKGCYSRNVTDLMISEYNLKI